MKIVLMGMPGVGKGTQAARLSQRTGLQHVSTGDILRDAVREGTALGRKVKDTLASGALVPDEWMGELIEHRLARADVREGFLLDGFPRTAAQVEILDRVAQRLGLAIDGVYLLTAPEEEIVRRLSGRRVCPRCATVYHLETEPPASPSVCDGCGSALVQRPDDTEQVIRDRIRVFSEQTLPAVEIYRRRGMLHEVPATGEPDAVERRLRQALESL